ncbi:adhesion G protein-coupled receptor E2-like [Dysidea avara]|uniref:adhesion G protein-coupled receptor E2-like n=1 Tax=Dysidea avara TaxID=196820 RepID=UPI003332BFE0
MIFSITRIYKSRKSKASLSQSQRSAYQTAKIMLWGVIALVPLLGLTWILGLLFLIDSDSVALAWIFTIVNSLQGAAVFFFYVVKNKEARRTASESFTKWRKNTLLRSTLKESFKVQRNSKVTKSSITMTDSILSKHRNTENGNAGSSSDGQKLRTHNSSFKESCFMDGDNDDKTAFADKDVLQDSLIY